MLASREESIYAPTVDNLLILKNLPSPSTGSGRTVIPRGKRWASQAQRQPTTASALGQRKGRPHLDPPLEKGEGEQRKASLCKWDI